MNSYHLCGTILFLAELESCQYEDLILAFKMITFNQRPPEYDSFADKIVNSICLNSYNNVVYLKDDEIVDLKRMNAVKDNTKFPIVEGLNDLPIDESRKMDINIELGGYCPCPKEIAKQIDLRCCDSEEAARITDSLREQGYSINKKYTGICENNLINKATVRFFL